MAAQDDVLDRSATHELDIKIATVEYQVVVDLVARRTLHLSYILSAYERPLGVVALTWPGSRMFHFPVGFIVSSCIWPFTHLLSLASLGSLPLTFSNSQVEARRAAQASCCRFSSPLAFFCLIITQETKVNAGMLNATRESLAHQSSSETTIPGTMTMTGASSRSQSSTNCCSVSR